MNADGKSDESVVPPTSMNKDAADASTESNEEFIYPTEYEPARLPENVHLKKEEDAGVATAVRRNRVLEARLIEIENRAVIPRQIKTWRICSHISGSI